MAGLTLCHCSAHSDRSAWTRLCSDSCDTLSSLSQACRDLGITSSPPLRQFCRRPVRLIHQCVLSNLLCPNTTHRGQAHGERPSCLAVPEINLRPFSRKQVAGRVAFWLAMRTYKLHSCSIATSVEVTCTDWQPRFTLDTRNVRRESLPQ
jgi:hypothetical protein